jgi:hypothetical protein
MGVKYIAHEFLDNTQELFRIQRYIVLGGASMKVKFSSLAALTICLLLLASGAFAGNIPYSDPANSGTQAYTGNLGLDFTVSSSITITQMGVFNAAGDGIITGTIDVAIFNTNTGFMVLGTMAVFQGAYATGGLGYDVFQHITPVTLGPGSYAVVAVGFSGTDLNGNINFNTSGPLLDNLGGKLTFTGASYDGNPTLDNPTTCVGCQSPPAQWRQFDAGTFAVPESSTLATLLGFGIFNLAVVFGVRRKLI